MTSNIRSSRPSVSIDTAEQIMLEAEQGIARLRDLQMSALQLLDEAQVATADGARTLSEWVARRMDVSRETARSLVRTMRRTENRPELRQALTEGDSSFDRVEAASKILSPSGDPLQYHLDISAVHREAARRARISAAVEDRSFLDQFLFIQSTLDQSWAKVYGGLEGHAAAIVEKTLNEIADSLPLLEGEPKDPAWRRAVALTQLCISDDPPPTQVSVFVDADTATPTSGQAGVYLEAGSRVGRSALEAVLCESVLEVTVNTADGTPLSYGRRSRAIPPALRRAILHRDGNRCSIAGCGSRNRLQVHHVTPWSQGGATDPENLITLCWWHHHVAIHRLGFTPYRHPKHGQVWLRPNGRSPPE